jgi:hypothetical protein
LWKTKDGTYSSGTANRGRVAGNIARNVFITGPVVGTSVAGGVDLFGNAIGAAGEPDNVEHEWKWPATKFVTAPIRGLFNLY